MNEASVRGKAALSVIFLLGAVHCILALLLAQPVRGQSAVNATIPVNGTDVDADPIRNNLATIKSELNTLFNRFPSGTATRSVPVFADGAGNLTDPGLCAMFGETDLMSCDGHLELYGRNGIGTVLGIVADDDNTNWFLILDEALESRVVMNDSGTQFTGAGGASTAFVIESGPLPTSKVFQVKQVGSETFSVGSDGNVTITANDTDTGLAIKQSSSGTVLKEETETDGANPVRVTKQGRVATTDATETAIVTVPTATNSITYIKATVVARVTGGAGGFANQGAAFEVHGAFDNVAGTVNELATQAITEIALTDTNTGSYAIDMDVSGTNVLVTVTGGATDNVTWHATVEYMTNEG